MPIKFMRHNTIQTNKNTPELNGINSGNNGLSIFLSSPMIIFFFISLVTLAVFFEVLKADFLMWDDDAIIYKNPNIGELGFDRIRWVFTDFDSMMRYNPLTLLGWVVTYHIVGMDPFWFHFGNWVFHGFSSGLLFLIIRKILQVGTCHRNDSHLEIRINIFAAISTLFWSLHPMRVESVAWATDRTYCQSVFFLFLSTYSYLKANDSEFQSKRYYLLIVTSLIFYIGSLLSYAIGITYFFIFLIFDVYLYKRIGGQLGWLNSQTVKRVFWEKIIFAMPALAIAGITLFVRIKSAGIWDPPVPLSEFGLLPRFMQAMYIIAYYVYRPFYPIDLVPVYSKFFSFDPLSNPFLGRAIGVFVISSFIFIFRKRWPLGVALLWTHLLLLIPVLGIFEYPHYHSDRYAILSSIGLSVLLAFTFIYFKSKKIYITLTVFMVFTVMILGGLTFNQVKIWNNSETFFKYTIKKLGNDPYRQDIYWRLGKFLYEKGRREEAKINFLNVLKINPFHSIANGYLKKLEHDQEH